MTIEHYDQRIAERENHHRVMARLDAVTAERDQLRREIEVARAYQRGLIATIHEVIDRLEQRIGKGS